MLVRIPVCGYGVPGPVEGADPAARAEAITYVLPLSLEHDMVGPSDVAKFFSASDVSNLVSVDEARAVHRLLGVEIDGRYRYPVFQFDRERKRIKPVAEYANVVMECDLDPWGTLDWWCTAQPHLGDRRPVDVLNAGELSAYDVDRMIGHDRAGMD